MKPEHGTLNVKIFRTAVFNFCNCAAKLKCISLIVFVCVSTEGFRWQIADLVAWFLTSSTNLTRPSSCKRLTLTFNFL